MTSPSAESDLLIACASFIWSPAAPDFFTLRETHEIAHNTCSPVKVLPGLL